MSFTVAQVLAPLRRVVLMIVVNCLPIPAAAWGLFTVFGIKAAYVSGATLAAVGATGAAHQAGAIGSWAGVKTRVSVRREVTEGLEEGG